MLTIECFSMRHAKHYIRKPGDFLKLKEVILMALTIAPGSDSRKNNFVLKV